MCLEQRPLVVPHNILFRFPPPHHYFSLRKKVAHKTVLVIPSEAFANYKLCACAVSNQQACHYPVPIFPIRLILLCSIALLGKAVDAAAADDQQDQHCVAEEKDPDGKNVQGFITVILRVMERRDEIRQVGGKHPVVPQNEPEEEEEAEGQVDVVFVSILPPRIFVVIVVIDHD